MKYILKNWASIFSVIAQLFSKIKKPALKFSYTAKTIIAGTFMTIANRR